MTQKTMKNLLACLALLSTALLIGSSSAEELYPPKDLIIPSQSEWTKAHYPARIAEFKTNPLSMKDIVFLGDSITEKGENWGTRLHAEHVKNRGISGDVTDGVLARMNELYHFKPNALFILIGINDLLGAKIPADHVADNIIKIADLMHRESPSTKIYVQTILPTNHNEAVAAIHTVNRILLAKKDASYNLIDLHSHFSDKTDHIKPEYTVDGVHLSEAGYSVWIAQVQKYVDAANKR
jgi:lysophospholipase L1-like esterase